MASANWSESNMTAPVWLIAEREFRTYVMTASFWVALAIGPLTAVATLALSHATPVPLSVDVRAPDPQLTRAAQGALLEAGLLEGKHFKLAPADITNTLTLIPTSRHALEARFSGGFPLSAAGRGFVARTLERDAARATAPAPLVVLEKTDAASRDAGTPSRFALMMILWLALTGSLGMLLQTVVRERANRALETLLAAARPSEIVAGKILGVGAISGLVVLVWLGSGVAVAALAPAQTGFMPQFLSVFAAPLMLVRAIVIYALAFAFYGLVTVALGAMARDSASAQNLSRPMFIVLVVAFFIPLASPPAWLAWAPPLAPFLLLLQGPRDVSLTSDIGALGLLLAATAVAAHFAIGRLTLPGAAANSAG
jgi:ABC-2 type transport system permease protein